MTSPGPLASDTRFLNPMLQRAIPDGLLRRCLR
jgi:hypothetical protein